MLPLPTSLGTHIIDLAKCFNIHHYMDDVYFNPITFDTKCITVNLWYGSTGAISTILTLTILNVSNRNNYLDIFKGLTPFLA